MQLPLTVIVPYYTGLESLEQFLKTLDGCAQTVVVNNSAKKLKPAKVKNLRVVDLPFNTGFAHACNIGSFEAETEWVLFANSDIEISPTQLEKLLTVAQTENLDCISPVLTSATNTVAWQYHQPIPAPLSIFLQFSPLKKLFVQKSFARTTLPGACLLIKKSVLENCGCWDERFFIWWEDSDLSKRLVAKGFKIKVVEEVYIKHQGGESFSALSDTQKRALFFHSLEIFSKKYFSFLTHWALQLFLSRFFSNRLYPADSQLAVSVVVPNLKKELLETFLLENIQSFDFSKLELIIVTSAQNLQHLRKKYPAVIFITLEKNSGFAATVNIGLRRARGENLITVNDDTILPTDWAGKLLTRLESTVGTVSPHIVKKDGSSESLGIHILPIGKAVPLHSVEDTKQHRNAFNAAAVLFSRAALEKVGLFSERFGSYLEDLDLGLRMCKRGFTHQVVATVKIIHLGQQTSSSFPIKKSWQDLKNWWLLILGNYTFADYAAGGPRLLIERARNLSGFLKVVFKTQ